MQVPLRTPERVRLAEVPGWQGPVGEHGAGSVRGKHRGTTSQGRRAGVCACGRVSDGAESTVLRAQAPGPLWVYPSGPLHTPHQEWPPTMARVPEKVLEWLLGASGHRTRPRTYSWPALAVCAEHIRGTNTHFPSAWGMPASGRALFTQS